MPELLILQQFRPRRLGLSWFPSCYLGWLLCDPWGTAEVGGSAHCSLKIVSLVSLLSQALPLCRGERGRAQQFQLESVLNKPFPVHKYFISQKLYADFNWAEWIEDTVFNDAKRRKNEQISVFVCKYVSVVYGWGVSHTWGPDCFVIFSSRVIPSSVPGWSFF